MIALDCPSCFRQYKLKPEFAGRKIRCKECGEPIAVPSADDPDIEAYEDDFEESPARLPGNRGQKSPVAAKDASRWMNTMFGRGGKVWTQWGIFLLLCVVGLFYPAPIKMTMMAWAVVSLGLVFVGLFWLAANCFKSAPVDAIVMVLLPFIGFIGASSRIDLFNPQNERPFRLTWRGLWSFLAALVATMVMVGVEQNRPLAAGNPEPPPPHFPHQGPRDPNLMPPDPATGRNVVDNREPRAPENHNPHLFHPGAPGGQQSAVNPNRTFPFTINVATFPEPVDALKPKLEIRLSTLSFYVANSLTIDEKTQTMTVEFNEPPKPAVFNPLFTELRNVGVQIAPSTRPAAGNNRVGKFTPGPIVVFYYNSLPGTPEEAITLLQTALKDIEWVIREEISIVPGESQIVVRLTDVSAISRRSELMEPIHSTGIELK